MEDQPGRVRAITRGLLKRCPRCGAGGLFERWFTMKPACPRCGLVFEREEGFFLGAFVLNFAVTEFVLGIVIALGVIATRPDVAVGALGAVAVAETVLVPLAWYPFSKTTWAALDLVMHPR